MRRRGVVMLHEEDIARLLKLGPGEWVSGVMGDDLRIGILIRIDGDETSDLATCAPGHMPQQIERPFAMVEMRRRLLAVLAADQTPEETAAEIRSILAEELLS